jgi:type IV pilus assembly protein PilM
MGLLSTNRITEMLPSLGIDFGSHVAKFVQVEAQSAGRIEVRAAGGFPIEDGMIEGGIVKDAKRLGKSIAAQLRRRSISQSAVVVSVPSNLAVLRWVQLPNLPAEELRDAARYKVKRHLPFPVHNAYVEASTPDILDGEATGESLVIAVPRDVIDTRAEAIEYAGLIPVGMELEAQSILRVIERKLNEQSALWRDASLTIIDVGANNTHMYVVQNQKLQFIRGVKFGTSGIIGAIGKEFNLSRPEAERLIAQPGAELWTDGILKLQFNDVPAYVYVQNELDKLIREFLRLMRYFRSLHPERSYAGILDHIVVCGGIASLPGFAEYLHEALELRVERARPFAGMVGKFNKETFDVIANRQEAYTVVVGLALAALKGRMKTTGEADGGSEYAWTRVA